MKATIQNFRGISSAELSLGNLSLIAGANNQGKSSIIMAIAAAITGKTIPIDIPKSSAGMLVRGGSASSSVSFETDNGCTKVLFPSAEKTSEGTPFEISEFAAGLDNLVNYKPKDLSAKLGELLNFSISLDDLKAELPDLAPASMEKLYQTIQVQGIDAALTQAKEAGARLKGGWEQITGQRYGSSKAESWLPAAWEPDLESETEASLRTAVGMESEYLQVAISSVAVSDSETKILQDQIDAGQKAFVRLTDLQKELDGLKKTSELIIQALEAMPKPEQPAVTQCPHCSKDVQIDGTALIVPVIIPQDEIDRRAQSIKDSEQSIIDINIKISDIVAEQITQKGIMSTAEKATAALKKLSFRKGNSTQEAVEECRTRKARAEARLNAWIQKSTADNKRTAIASNQKIIDTLAPDGIRQRKLAESLKKFNDICSMVCTVSGWRPVEISPDMSISMSGTPYMLLSGSERWRVRCILQCAVAIIDGSKLVLLDEADILDTDNRRGLIKLLLGINSGHGIASVVGMTQPDKTKLPDLGKYGGAVYFIENGIAVAN